MSDALKLCLEKGRNGEFWESHSQNSLIEEYRTTVAKAAKGKACDAITRETEDIIDRMLSQGKVVLATGTRQAGRTRSRGII